MTDTRRLAFMPPIVGGAGSHNAIAVTDKAITEVYIHENASENTDSDIPAGEAVRGDGVVSHR